MKNLIKIFLIISVFIFAFKWLDISSAGVFKIESNTFEDVQNASIEIEAIKRDSLWESWTEYTTNTITSIVTTVLWIVKNILSAIIILFLVYAGANMVLAMWADDEKLTSSKNQIWYSAIGLLFINIPWTLFSAFYSWGGEVNESWMTNDDFNREIQTGNLFVNEGIFQNVFYNEIVRFMQISIFGLAIIVIILAGYKLLIARGKDEDVSDARSKILYSVIALFFVWFIEALKRVAFVWNLTETAGLFSAITNLILLFAAPVAIFFLFLATFYYITAWGDEEKVKKAKNIVINTFLATILLMAIYTFILDLVDVPTTIQP